MKYMFAGLAFVASPLSAGVEEVVTSHILPGLDAFSTATYALHEAAKADCAAATLIDEYASAWEAWALIGDVKMGPTEDVVLSIAFWPDKKGYTQKKLREMITEENPVVDDLAAFEGVSVAARGFFALERMLFDESFNDFENSDYSCRLTRALAYDLAREAAELEQSWQANFVPVLLNPGAEWNATFLDAEEATRAVYTQIMSSLEWTADQRLGRPMDEPTRPRPLRAEAWRSDRALPNVLGFTDSAVNMARLLVDWELPATEEGLTRLHAAAEQIDDPSFQEIDDLFKRLQLEILQQEVNVIRAALEQEVGLTLGITPGFNSSDGD